MAYGDGDVYNDNEHDDAKVHQNHSKMLEASDTRRDYLQFNSAVETAISYFYELEKVASVIHQKKHKQ